MDLEEITGILLKNGGDAIIRNDMLEISINGKFIFAMEWDMENKVWIVWQHHRSMGIEWCPSYGIEMLVTLFKECL